MKLASVLVILFLGCSACASMTPLDVPVGQIVDNRIEWSDALEAAYWFTSIDYCHVGENSDEGCIVLKITDFQKLMNRCKRDK